MKPVRLLLVAFCLQLFAALDAQVPQLIDFQGRVAVDGVNFNGTGEFKFALVNGDGSGTFWSNDGTSAGGSEPSNAVAVAVAQGLYSVLLGDATLTNMTPISAAIFTNSDVRLRIWFNDRTNGFQQLSPDQRIAAVGYAMMAANVADGAVTSAKLADGAVIGSKIAPSAVGAFNIAPRSIGPLQLATNSAADSLHDSGGLVLSDLSNATKLLNAGYVRIGQVTTDVDYWRQVGLTMPTARNSHTAVWTGSEMIIWGGIGADGQFLNTGGRYNPVTETWSVMATNDAPTPRIQHAAVWTGKEMIIWGGGQSATGGRYDPITDSWRRMTTANAPAPRLGFTAIWTGQELIVWGGSGSIDLNTGARYNPSSDTWTPTSTNGAPPARYYHSAVWTGSEMIIWGGAHSTDTNPARLNTGARYNPSTDTWTGMTTTSAPSARSSHLSVWTGSQMIVWGGTANPITQFVTQNYLSSGGRFNPVTGIWTPTSQVNAPAPRSAHTAVWTGTEMIIWAGQGPTFRFNESGPAATLNSGARYNPARDLWTTIETSGAPGPRINHTAVWTGNAMIVWGGSSTNNPELQNTSLLNTGGRYDPEMNAWTSLTTSGAPAPRLRHTAVWTGTEMIVWGGFGRISSNALGALATGGRYQPASNTWIPTSTIGTPEAVQGHTAIWTGNEMITFGGMSRRTTGSKSDFGGRYTPKTDSWTLLALTNSPPLVSGHSAVWTGKEMIVWGGTNATLRLPTGGRYNPSNDTWDPVTVNGIAAGRSAHTAVWTGSSMLIFGGIEYRSNASSTTPDLVDSYSLTKPMYLYKKP